MGYLPLLIVPVDPDTAGEARALLEVNHAAQVRDVPLSEQQYAAVA